MGVTAVTTIETGGECVALVPPLLRGPKLSKCTRQNVDFVVQGPKILEF